MTTLLWSLAHASNRLKLDAIGEPHVELIDVPDLGRKLTQCPQFRELYDRMNRNLRDQIKLVVNANKAEFKAGLKTLDC